MKLEIESIPMSSWGLSLANKLGKREWDKIRHRVYEDASYSCSICEDSGIVLHCHEVWNYDFRAKVQRLKGFRCVCETCHNVIHMGRSKEVYGKDTVKALISHWCNINGKNLSDFVVHANKVHQDNLRKTRIFWIVKVGRRIIV